MSDASAASSTNLRSTLLILCVAAAGMGALLALLPAAGHDQLWFLLMAQRWMNGATLYGPQIFDSNPPAIVWASAIPVFLGHLLHVPATLPAKLLVLFAEAAGAALSYRVLRHLRPNPAGFEDVALGLAFIVLFLVLPARDFGQRDHLLAVLIMPYLLAAALPSAVNLRKLRAATGSLAAIGICLKPQYAVIPLAVELFFFIRPHPMDRWQRLSRPEPALLLLIGTGYLLCIRALTPLYLSEALPILRNTYWAVGHLSLADLSGQAIELCILSAVTGSLFLRKGYRSPEGQALLTAATAAFAAYFFQGTGWYYQQLPALALFGAALAFQLIDRAARRPPTLPAWTPKAALALSVLALALTTHFMGYPFTQDRAFAIDTPDPAIFAAMPPQTSVAMLTTSVDATMMPVERYQLTWAQRTNNLWLLPAILRSETPGSSEHAGQPPRRRLSPESLAGLEALQHRWMVEDLTRWQPQVVLVERCQMPKVHCQLLEDRDDNLLAWFLTDSAFAEVWRHYRLQRTSGHFDEYIRAN